ncbi:regulatory protein RecX [Bacteroides sp. 224]|uniref:regulatory protein RecX n=1 Tax=Bacteroides sp. 224 TaxID=2302936 RepID=UPI0013D26F7D|nr:regulatory protein RecX [Bacteroides sp. 224]NDV66390.1 RecX family transcriptional regulator [Bacteroides sp. 224]
MKEITEKEAFSRMASYCSMAEHCCSEVIEKLKKWELATEQVECIIKALQAEKYIDEERYCRSFINDKIRFSKWGKRKIAMALYQKRIPDAIIQKHLNEVDEEEYLSILKQLLEAKKKSIKAKDEYEFRGKLFRFAMGRGFDVEDVEKVR